MAVPDVAGAHQTNNCVAGDWASFTTPRPGAASAAAPAWDAFTQAETPPKGVQFTPPAPKALRQATPADLEAVANGESLQLLETWQGSFTGSKLLKAGSCHSKHLNCQSKQVSLQSVSQHKQL